MSLIAKLKRKAIWIALFTMFTKGKVDTFKSHTLFLDVVPERENDNGNISELMAIYSKLTDLQYHALDMLYSKVMYRALTAILPAGHGLNLLAISGAHTDSAVVRLHDYYVLKPHIDPKLIKDKEKLKRNKRYDLLLKLPLVPMYCTYRHYYEEFVAVIYRMRFSGTQFLTPVSSMVQYIEEDHGISFGNKIASLATGWDDLFFTECRRELCNIIESNGDDAPVVYAESLNVLDDIIAAFNAYKFKEV